MKQEHYMANEEFFWIQIFRMERIEDIFKANDDGVALRCCSHASDTMTRNDSVSTANWIWCVENSKCLKLISQAIFGKRTIDSLTKGWLKLAKELSESQHCSLGE